MRLAVRRRDVGALRHDRMRGERDPFGRDEEAVLVGIEMVGLARQARREVDDERATRFPLAGHLAHDRDQILEAHRHHAVGELQVEQPGRELHRGRLVRIGSQSLDRIEHQQELVVELRQVHPQAAQQRRECRALLVGGEKAVANIAGDDELRADRQQPLQVGDPARRGIHGNWPVTDRK